MLWQENLPSFLDIGTTGVPFWNSHGSRDFLEFFKSSAQDFFQGRQELNGTLSGYLLGYFLAHLFYL